MEYHPFLPDTTFIFLSKFADCVIVKNPAPLLLEQSFYRRFGGLYTVVNVQLVVVPLPFIIGWYASLGQLVPMADGDHKVEPLIIEYSARQRAWYSASLNHR